MEEAGTVATGSEGGVVAEFSIYPYELGICQTGIYPFDSCHRLTEKQTGEAYSVAGINKAT